LQHDGGSDGQDQEAQEDVKGAGGKDMAPLGHGGPCDGDNEEGHGEGNVEGSGEKRSAFEKEDGNSEANEEGGKGVKGLVDTLAVIAGRKGDTADGKDDGDHEGKQQNHVPVTTCFTTEERFIYTTEVEIHHDTIIVSL